MLFHEIYGSYYQVVAAVLEEAMAGDLTTEGVHAIVQEKAFAESVLTIPQALLSGEWPLLDDALHTPLQHTTRMPLSLLEKRWLKALLSDPRMQLFSCSAEGLEDIEPLFTHGQIVVYDRYTDGDPFTDPAYIARFQTILHACRAHKPLALTYSNIKLRKEEAVTLIPHHLEYSAKDDKFRLVGSVGEKPRFFNLSHILNCHLIPESATAPNAAPTFQKESVVLHLTDERNALERVLLQFSDLEKTTARLNENTYALTLHYAATDRSEMIIRVLAFGPVVEVLAPPAFRNDIRTRIFRQCNYFDEATSQS